MRVADSFLRHPRTLCGHLTFLVLELDLKSCPEQLIKQCAFARALVTNYSNGAVIPTESKQIILGQKIVKRLSSVLKIEVNYVYFDRLILLNLLLKVFDLLLCAKWVSDEHSD